MEDKRLLCMEVTFIARSFIHIFSISQECIETERSQWTTPTPMQSVPETNPNWPVAWLDLCDPTSWMFLNAWRTLIFAAHIVLKLVLCYKLSRCLLYSRDVVLGTRYSYSTVQVEAIRRSRFCSYLLEMQGRINIVASVAYATWPRAFGAPSFWEKNKVFLIFRARDF